MGWSGGGGGGGWILAVCCDTVVTEHERVIAALATVPEKTLRIVELARELVGADGQLDTDRAAAMAPEVNLAVAEANAYARATAQAIQALRGLTPRQ